MWLDFPSIDANSLREHRAWKAFGKNPGQKGRQVLPKTGGDTPSLVFLTKKGENMGCSTH